LALFVQAECQEFIFSHYGLKDGLSQSVVNCIFQDSEEYMWFGTQNGLNRFDGYSFKKYISNPLDSTSLPDNRIFAITGDKFGNLWIGTINGLVRYNKKTNTFAKIEFRPKNNLSFTRAVNGLSTSSDGNILINSKGLFSILDPKSLSVKHFFPDFPIDGAVYDQNRPIIEDSNGNFWLGTQAGLCKFNRKTKKFEYFNQYSEPALTGCDISALFEDKRGNICIGSSTGMEFLDPYKKTILDFEPLNGHLKIRYLIRAIRQDKYLNYWIATENGGLFKVKLNGLKLSGESFEYNQNDANGLSHNIIYSLLIDKSENLWVGTLNGIDKTDLKQKKFRLYRKTFAPNSVNIADNVIASLFKDDNDLIWIGTWGSGLNIFDRNTGKIIHYSSQFNDYRHIPNNFVHVIFKDSQNQIWIGTRNGINIFDRRKNGFADYRKFFPNNHFPDFENNRIYCMLENHDHNFVIGTANGLHILNPKTGNTKSFYSEDSTISGNLIYSLLEDKDHEIWIATTNGLDRYNPGTGKFTHYRRNNLNPNSIIDNFVVSLRMASDGKIWVGTNSGINRLDKKTGNFEFFPEFPSNIIYDILEDKQKNIWLSSGLGLSRFDNKTQQFVNYGLEDGLQSLEFNLKACFLAKDGEVFFGGMNGFNSFYPDSIHKISFLPNIVITAIEIESQKGKKSVNFSSSDTIIMTHKDKVISLDFASLDYTNPTKNKYAYEMVGLSEKRIEYDTRRRVTFLNLPAGEYEFRVYGTNSDGIWSEKPAQIWIKVLPPWWRNNYAYSIYIAVILLIILLFIKLREKNLKDEKKLLEKKVEIRTQEILSQKDEIMAQKDEIEKQKTFVEEQRDQIASKNLEINDSLVYAKRIQTAVLPNKKQFEENFDDFFIFFQPKDIVSGDFYWIKNIADKCYFAVADCTGHGVPGAFVSMLGISFLNEIVQTCATYPVGELLDKLRLKIKEALQQTGKNDETKDGLDIALAMYDKTRMKLEFSGANNYGLIIQNQKLHRLEADKMPIGIHGLERAFNTQNLDLNKGDIIYLFSDGYMDQFGGKTRKKFMSKNFNSLLEKIYYLPMEEQLKEVKQVLTDWKGDCSQVDDITVIGVKI